MRPRVACWIGHYLDWVAGLEPMCPGLEEAWHVPLAVEGAMLRRGTVADPWDDAILMASHGVARPAALRALVLAAMEGDALALAALEGIAEGRIEVVGE